MLDLGLPARERERELPDIFTRSDPDVTCSFHFSFVVHHHHPITSAMCKEIIVTLPTPSPKHHHHYYYCSHCH